MLSAAIRCWDASAAPAGSSALPVLPRGTVGTAAIPVSGHTTLSGLLVSRRLLGSTLTQGEEQENILHFRNSIKNTGFRFFIKVILLGYST